ncbi:hypothetical protein ABH309_19385 [Chromobacterium piscinae]|uniref:Uncharacterized protein n=1 Tax=Chromobacterium piscinae TaxID=686831 RepID=A0ABV0H9Z4_9NEIS
MPNNRVTGIPYAAIAHSFIKNDGQALNNTARAIPLARVENIATVLSTFQPVKAGNAKSPTKNMDSKGGGGDVNSSEGSGVTFCPPRSGKAISAATVNKVAGATFCPPRSGKAISAPTVNEVAGATFCPPSSDKAISAPTVNDVVRRTFCPPRSGKASGKATIFKMGENLFRPEVSILPPDGAGSNQILTHNRSKPYIPDRYITAITQGINQAVQNIMKDEKPDIRIKQTIESAYGTMISAAVDEFMHELINSGKTSKAFRNQLKQTIEQMINAYCKDIGLPDNCVGGNFVTSTEITKELWNDKTLDTCTFMNPTVQRYTKHELYSKLDETFSEYIKKHHNGIGIIELMGKINSFAKTLLNHKPQERLI